jgi:hypothetical protein
MVSSGIKSPSINMVITALRFLFTIALDRQEAVKKICPIHEPRILPEILSHEDVTRTINATQKLLKDIHSLIDMQNDKNHSTSQYSIIRKRILP